MQKPDDISQEAWDAVDQWADWYGADPFRKVEETIARAIMAAKAEERRAIQTAVQDMAVPAEFSNSWQLGYRQCRIDAVSAIRKRSE